MPRYNLHIASLPPEVYHQTPPKQRPEGYRASVSFARNYPPQRHIYPFLRWLYHPKQLTVALRAGQTVQFAGKDLEYIIAFCVARLRPMLDALPEADAAQADAVEVLGKRVRVDMDTLEGHLILNFRLLHRIASDRLAANEPMYLFFSQRKPEPKL